MQSELEKLRQEKGIEWRGSRRWVLQNTTPTRPRLSAQRTGWMMLITGVAALGFKAGPQQDLPPAFGTRSILQRVDQSNSENNATYNAS